MIDPKRKNNNQENEDVNQPQKGELGGEATREQEAVGNVGEDDVTLEEEEIDVEDLPEAGYADEDEL